jgi:two-component system response regulator MtrA
MRVLVVEDDPSLREVVVVILERAGFDVAVEADGGRALARVADERFDLLVLDVLLPGVDGFEVCRAVRAASSVPIVMLTARSATADLVTGLELGADDDVTKPFEASELTARVRAVLRRAALDGRGGDDPCIEAGPLVVDTAAAEVRLDGEPVRLTETEYKLLVELARRPGEVLARERLLRLVWGYDYLGDSRLVDVPVGRLRDKRADDPRTPRYIATVRGVGYRFGGCAGRPDGAGIADG